MYVDVDDPLGLTRASPRPPGRRARCSRPAPGRRPTGRRRRDRRADGPGIDRPARGGRRGRSTRACASGTCTCAPPTSTDPPLLRGVLGFDVVAEAEDVPGWGTTGDILFVAAGGYHHHLGFNTWKSAGGPPQPDGVAGLHHVALDSPTPGRAGRRRAAAGRGRRPIRQATDHGTHKRSTSAIPTATTWSWPGTVRPSSGRATPRATSPGPWTSRSTSRPDPRSGLDADVERGGVAAVDRSGDLGELERRSVAEHHVGRKRGLRQVVEAAGVAVGRVDAG